MFRTIFVSSDPVSAAAVAPNAAALWWWLLAAAGRHQQQQPHAARSWSSHHAEPHIPPTSDEEKETRRAQARLTKERWKHSGPLLFIGWGARRWHRGAARLLLLVTRGVRCSLGVQPITALTLLDSEVMSR